MSAVRFRQPHRSYCSEACLWGSSPAGEWGIFAAVGREVSALAADGGARQIRFGCSPQPPVQKIDAYKKLKHTTAEKIRLSTLHDVITCLPQGALRTPEILAIIRAVSRRSNRMNQVFFRFRHADWIFGILLNRCRAKLRSKRMKDQGSNGH